jgi:4-amino-4-deoxychorismate lyase
MSAQQYLVNGQDHALLSPMDRGLTYGDGVFRTMPVRCGIVDHWQLHYSKLAHDCAALDIACPDAEVLLDDLRRLFANDEIAVAKIIVTRGEGERGYKPSVTEKVTRVLIKTPFPTYTPENFSEGVALHLCRLRLSRQPRLAGIKHLNRLENVLARSEWTDASLAEGLLLDDKSYVIECVASNIFARFGKMLLTPDLSQCGVAGITRQRILEAAARLDYRSRIARLTLSRLMQADEVIICNSLYGAWQVKSLQDRHWQPQELAATLRLLLQE